MAPLPKKQPNINISLRNPFYNITEGIENDLSDFGNDARSGGTNQKPADQDQRVYLEPFEERII
jgi:hypothetical protein